MPTFGRETPHAQNRSKITMPIIAKFDIDKLFTEVYKKVDMITVAVEEALQMVCLEIIQKAKTEYGTGNPTQAGHPHQPNYIEWTHYLKGSIGYVVYNDGEKIAEHFDGGGGKGNDGVAKGQQLAEQVASNYPMGFVAVMVAGAEYAAYVESKGYDVLTGATSEASGILKKYLQIAVEEINKA